ncbi:TetR/AcrR family transcriptional regulator [Mycolicibacterium vinylchloridicum]|uniref:TetR/AcrR family transcriptional regulator n=1 Tax=Mycolicibacterium vinylchloridicum TaxID=2736928 RepID=UPI0015CAD793|nr:TetR/AcrR family transcriptional regulator [Mycolicibacterium vinylchloridicum]
MPRYPVEHKADTRRRIVETAGRRLKSDGIDGSGIAALMGDAGLTNGAFYAHFESKSDLVATVVAEQLAAQVALLEALPASPDAITSYVRAYLAPEHRDDAAGGCPSAALLDEIGRCDDAVQHAYNDGVQRILEVIAASMVAAYGAGPDQAWERAVGVWTVMVATIQLARAVCDPALSDRILAAGVNSALTLVRELDDRPRRAPAARKRTRSASARG